MIARAGGPLRSDYESNARRCAARPEEDVGCGEGRLTTFAAERAGTVYAFDPNAEDVAAARTEVTSEQRKRVRFAVHAAEAVNLPRERFAVALCGWSL